MSYFIHESSYEDKGVSIGNGTKIWHFCHISARANIGENCVIGQNVFIGEGVEIGSDVKIQNNVSVYSGVTIENEVFIGPSAVFTNVMNPRSSVERKTEYAKTYVSRGVTIGANATIVCGVNLRSFSFIGAGAVVTKDTKEFGLYAGSPCTQRGWYSKFGERIPLPIISSGKYFDQNDNSNYELVDGQMIC